MALEKQLADINRSANGTCITIGTFDGVHLGHQALLKQCVEAAKHQELSSIALTFKDPPRAVLDPSRPILYLSGLRHRIGLIRKMGIDVVHTIDFNDRVRTMSAAQFIDLLCHTIHMRCLVIGEGARIGHDQAGVDELRHLGGRKGFSVISVRPLRSNYGIISSSAIRGALGRGDVRQAAALLGRLYQRGGEVIVGTGRARKMNAPTANMKWDRSIVMPADGIYATWAELPDGRFMPSGTYIGKNPTLGGSDHAFETYISGIDEDLYGKIVRVQFVEFIRHDQTFESVESLQAQIKRDVERIEEIMDREKPPRLAHE